MKHVHYDDEETKYVNICPINKVNNLYFKLHFILLKFTFSYKLKFWFQALNMICCWIEDPNSDAFKQHLPRFFDYLWLSEDGMKAQVCTKLNFM
jgi:achilleol B synthase